MTIGKPFQKGQSGATGVVLKEETMPVVLWLLGVPIIVIVALYLLHVI